MKKNIWNLLLISITLIFPQAAFAQAGIINTIAGNHITGYSGNGGPATAAELWGPAAVATDKQGNLYISEEGNHIVAKVNSSGIINTVAGNYSYGFGYSGDGGAATAAELGSPTGLTFDKGGNMYISDYNESVIRKVNTNGIITTIAGNYSYGFGYSGDGGPATAAELNYPNSVVVDAAGNIYIDDSNNNVVRKVSTSGTISTIAGIHIQGYTGDGGPATAAELKAPYFLALDTNQNLYIADAENNVIRKVDKSSGIITTVAGNHTAGYSGDGGAATAAELNNPIGIGSDDSDNIYIAEENTPVIRKVNIGTGKISTIAGGLNGGYAGDGGLATAAELDQPFDVTTDSKGNIYIADYGNYVVRKVNSYFIITTGIKSVTNNEQLLIYPNPSRGRFTLAIKKADISAKQTIEVYDLTGKCVYRDQFMQIQNAYTFNISNNPNGIYFYKVFTESGNQVETGKLIIEK